MNTTTAPLARSGGAASNVQALPDLLARLESLRVRLALSPDGRRIIVDTPRGAMTLEVKRAIAAHKPALLALLAPPADLPADASPRAGLPDGSGLACNRGARHHAFWTLVTSSPDLRSTPRWVCRLCEPDLYARVIGARQDALQGHYAARTGEGVSEATSPASALRTRQERDAASRALLAWGEAHGYPRHAYAYAQGASTGVAAPFLSMMPGAEGWRRFADNAPGADLLAACHAAGILTDTPPSPKASPADTAPDARPDAGPDAPVARQDGQEGAQGASGASGASGQGIETPATLATREEMHGVMPPRAPEIPGKMVEEIHEDQEAQEEGEI